MAQPSMTAAPSGGALGQHEQAGIVWVKQGSYVRPQNVSVGLTDGVITEITAQALKEGTEVVIGEQLPGTAAGPGGGRSPFAPQFKRPQRGTATEQPPAGAAPKPKQ